jgi:tRNA modification GTPase
VGAALGADTIAAIATPPGVSAIAVVRISGPRARDIARRCFVARAASGPVVPGKLVRGWVRDPETNERLDDALAVHFFAPRSFTGEDVVELHVHGGRGVVASIFALILRLGARMAGPGEFSQRAFVNGRMDLAQAEAVADLIAAESEQAAKAAAYRLSSGVGPRLRSLRAALLERLVEIEAHVDYPDEVNPPDEEAIARCIRSQTQEVAAMLAGCAHARVLRDGIACVIAGPPNAGKSSLLNALLRADRAIVSDVPGTTRDVIEDRVQIDGVVLRLFDTAGLRAADNPIEAEGVARAAQAIDEAQLVITVIDGSRELDRDDRAAITQTNGRARILLLNKLDLGTAALPALQREFPEVVADRQSGRFIAGSVRRPETIDEVRKAIAAIGWGGAAGGSRALVANLRQIDCLTRAQQALAHALATIESAYPVDLLSADMREAIAAYGEVTGETVTEEVLSGIFSRFCVGK